MREPSKRGPVGVLLASFIFAALLTVLAAWASGERFWFMERASTVAESVDRLFNIITWISIFFFLVIVILMVTFIVQYRRKDHYAKATSNVTHNTPLELTWTIIPLLLVIGIFYAGMEGYLDMRRAPAGAYEVHVTAARWSWNFTHPNGCQEPVLRVPLNRPVRLIMESQDVLHALFIPAFRVKQDIVPGRIIDLWFQATREGVYDLFCAEYCGMDHSRMHALVYVMQDDELESALQECADWARLTPDSHLAVAAAQRIFPRCSSCHSLDGRDGTGPTWRGMWEHVREGEVVFTDGTNLRDLMGPGRMFETPEDYIRDSILNPARKIVMNFQNAMPTFRGQLKDRELRGIIDFIKRIDEFDERGVPRAGTRAAEQAEQLRTGQFPAPEPGQIGNSATSDS